MNLNIKKLSWLAAAVLLIVWGTVSAQTQIPIVSGAATFDVSTCPSPGGPLSCSFQVILTSNVTISIINTRPGASIDVYLVQDSVGGRAVTWPASVVSPPSLNISAGQVTAASLKYNSALGQWFTVSGGSITSLPGNISPLGFGAVWDVQTVADCTFTISATVNCNGGEAPFKASDVGKIFFGTKGNGQNNGPAAGQLACPQTTISAVNSATQIVLNAACTVVCTPSGTTVCSIAWGTADDTAAINNAANAAWGGNVCRALELPGGYAFFSATIMGNNAGVGNACGGGTFTISGADLLSAGPAVYGRSSAATKLIPLPNFTYPCTGGVSGKACVFGIGNGTAHDFSVDGLNQDNAGSPHNVNLFELTGQVGNVGACPGGYTAYNLALGGWNLQSSTSQGLVFGANSCNLPILQNVNVMQFGAVPCAWNGGANTNAVYGLICFGGTGGILNLNGTGILNSYGGMYLALDTTNTGILNCSNTAATFNSHGDQFLTGNNAQIYTIGLCNQASTQTWTFDHSTLLLSPTAAATSQCFFLNSTNGMTVRFRDTKVTCTGTNNRALFLSAADKIFDDGGNTFTNGTVANTINGAVFGSSASTGVVQTAGNIVLSACGTSTVGTVSGTGGRGQFTITFAGTPGTSCTYTITFPTAFPFVAPTCSSLDVGGTNAFPTAITNGAISTTSYAVTETATAFTNGNTEIIQYSCAVP